MICYIVQCLHNVFFTPELCNGGVPATCVVSRLYARYNGWTSLSHAPRTLGTVPTFFQVVSHIHGEVYTITVEEVTQTDIGNVCTMDNSANNSMNHSAFIG